VKTDAPMIFFLAIVKKLFCDEPTNPNNRIFIDDGNQKSIGTQPSTNYGNWKNS
jgi:hypothetical protein